MPHAKPGGIPYARKPTGQIVSLKFLAEHLGLSQAAISLVINRSPAAKSIPRKTYYAFAPNLQIGRVDPGLEKHPERDSIGQNPRRGLPLREAARGYASRSRRRWHCTAPAQREADPVRQFPPRSEEHTSELQSRFDLVCRLLLEKQKTTLQYTSHHKHHAKKPYSDYT